MNMADFIETLAGSRLCPARLEQLDPSAGRVESRLLPFILLGPVWREQYLRLVLQDLSNVSNLKEGRAGERC